MADFDLLKELQASDYHSPTQEHVLAATNPTKVPTKKKPHRLIMEYVQLNTLVATYNLHFGHYSKSMRSVTQFIPSVVWMNRS
jgi:hypothetical protein